MLILQPILEYDYTIYLYLDAQMYRFQDNETSPDSFYDYPPSIRDNAVPLIIDNGKF